MWEFSLDLELYNNYWKTSSFLFNLCKIKETNEYKSSGKHVHWLAMSKIMLRTQKLVNWVNANRVMIISCIKWFCQIFDEDSVKSAVEEFFSESDEIFGIMGGIIRYSPPLCNCFPGRIYVYVLKMFQWPQLKAWENIKPIYKSSACTCPTIITITLFHWQSEQAAALFFKYCATH